MIDETFETRDHSVHSQIDLILKSFPFDEVKKIFRFMDFKYIQGIDLEYDPEIEDFIYLVTSLLKEVAKKGKSKKTNMTISSGRFEVFWNNDEETLSLKFIPFESEILMNEGEETIFVV